MKPGLFAFGVVILAASALFFYIQGPTSTLEIPSYVLRAIYVSGMVIGAVCTSIGLFSSDPVLKPVYPVRTSDRMTRRAR